MNTKSRTVFSVLVIFFLLLNPFNTSVWTQTSEPIYDVVIRNGRVLDGAGNPWVLADVAIKDGRFVRIGKVDGKGKREIDATGRYVSPGWIDMERNRSGPDGRTNSRESSMRTLSL